MKKPISVIMILAALVLATLAAGPVYGGNGGGDGRDKADQARQRHTAALMANQGVVGVAVGLNPAGKGAVLVLTAAAGVAGIPGQLDGVPVRVMVTGEIFARCHKGKNDPKGCGGPPPTPTPAPDPGTDCTSTTGHFRPACIGISTGHPNITAGIIGARLTDGTDVYALSNNHVYADVNAANIGDAVIQPGTYDGGSSPADDLGTLFDFEPIDFGATNTIDAAIALSSTALLGNATPGDGYGTPKSTTAEAFVGQRVMKYGRTTGPTKGRVYALNATVDVNYGAAGVATFVDQIIITPGGFSAGGDSGSLIVTDPKGKDKSGARQPVGLLFAGSNTVTIANPIDPVLARFGLTIDGE